MLAPLHPTKTHLALLALALFSSVAGYADRPVPPDNLQRVSIRGNVPPAANPANDVGRADPARVLHGVSLYFARTAAQQVDLERLLADQQNKRSPHYHQWLTPEQFGERFGASLQLIQSTAAWLQAQGLTIDEVSRSRDHIRFSGTVAQVETALHTQMHRYQVNGEVHIANSSEPEVPAVFSDSVLGFRSLHDFRPRSHSSRHPRPHFTSNISGNNFLLPDDFATIYDLKPFYDAGFTGGGRSIAVMGQTAINLSDIRAFRSAAGLSPNDPQPVLVPGSCQAPVVNNQCPDVSQLDIDESNLDLEWAGGVARDATIVYVYAGNLKGAFEAMEYAVTQDLAPVISISYGVCENDPNTTQSELLMLQMSAQQANAQGQTIIASAGDSGATDCDFNVNIATHGLQVDAPASIPEVTAIGGTTFTADQSPNQLMYWSAVNTDAFSGSALSFIPEGVWNDSDNTGLSAGGGGISKVFAKPSWQAGLPSFDQTHRYVPDVSFTSSPGHVGYLICSQNSCINGFRDADQNLDPIGGTSAPTPAFAAALTIFEQAQGTDPNHGLGNINPSIYAAAADPRTYTASFHDTVQGGNLSACLAGSPDCPNGGSIGYFTTTGYDLASGLGSADIFNLAAALTGKAFTAVTVSVDNNTPLVGQQVHATATITPANPGNVTGNLNFYLNGNRVAGPMPVTNNTAEFTISGYGSGVNTVAAAYFGDSNFAASSSIASPVIITALASSPTITLTANPTSLTLSTLGGSQTSQITATATGGFSGNVSLACTVTHLGNLTPANPPTCSLSPASVALSNVNPTSTTVLTVTGREQTAALAPPHDLRWIGFSSTAFACFFWLIPGDKKRRLARTAVLVISAAIVGCGGGGGGSSNGGGNTTPPVPVTSGSYQVTVTATGDGGVTSSVNVITSVQ